MDKKFKYKNLSKEQILISLDRLTRFKQTKEKYLRVFSDILTSCLIEPKIKKQDIVNLPFEEIVYYIEEIFNHSLDNSCDNDYVINKKLKDYENTLFKNDAETQKLLNNKINYKYAINYIAATSVINLQWLKSLETENDLKQARESFCLKYPIEKVFLVEGLTEELLLPAFAKFLEHDFYQKGIQIIPAGGKNQVVKMYYKLAEELNIPIFLLLDKDAEENLAQIKPKLRQGDKIHLVSCGEFEDILPLSLIIKTVNNMFENFIKISKKDFNQDLSMVKNLELIFKTKGLFDFKKADFAKAVKENIFADSDISDEIKNIIEQVIL